MPILNVDASSIIQQCAQCSATAVVPRAGLVLGHAHDDYTDPNLIALPTCVCGSQEFLNRTFDTAPEDVAAHRKKVNALAIDLKSKGHVHPRLKNQITSEKATPAQVGDLLGPVPVAPGLAAPVMAAGIVVPPLPAPAAPESLVASMRRKLHGAKRPTPPVDPARDARRAARLAHAEKKGSNA